MVEYMLSMSDSLVFIPSKGKKLNIYTYIRYIYTIYTHRYIYTYTHTYKVEQ